MSDKLKPIPFPRREGIGPLKEKPTLPLNPQEPVDLTQYREHRNTFYPIDSGNNRHNRRRNKAMAMNYLPVNYRKTLTDFPTNQELEKAGFPGNSAVIRTRLTGDDELYIASLQDIKKLNEEGELEAAIDRTELMIKIMCRCVESWSFKNYETGEVYPVNEENVRSLYKDDFDYLANEFAVVLNSLVSPAAETSEEEEVAPHKGLTDEEKNLLPSGSESEKKPSDPEEEVEVQG